LSAASSVHTLLINSQDYLRLCVRDSLATSYRVGKATIQRLEERADAKRVSSKMQGPLGAQYRISYTWYKVKGNLVFYWWEEFQEWISSTMEPSELRREGERVT
ncbi:MAG: hypothetical protein AB2669_16620, partial [Candidatus Thiodiazotropha endolucinida]